MLLNFSATKLLLLIFIFHRYFQITGFTVFQNLYKNSKNSFAHSFLLIFSFFILFGTYSNSNAQQRLQQLPKGQLLNVNPQNYISKKLTSHNIKSQIVFSDNFESENDSWIFSGTWQIVDGNHFKSSDKNTSKYVRLTRNNRYSNNSTDWLISTSIFLPLLKSKKSKLKLIFWECFETESGYDHGRIMLSTDFGKTWITIDDRSGKSDWREHLLDITDFQGQTIKIAFFFSSDESETFSGWMVDDLRIVEIYEEPLNATLLSLNHQNFPFIYMNVGVDTFGTGFPDLPQSSFSVHENNTLQTDYFEVTQPDVGDGVRLADIVFVLDITGSMEEEINSVKENMITFINALEASDVNFRVGIVEYADDNYVFNNGNLYSSTSTIINTINDIRLGENGLGNGVEWPEDGFDALKSAMLLNFRPGSQRIFIMLTDAPCHFDGDESIYTSQSDGNVTDYTRDTIIAELKANNITVYCVAADIGTDTGGYNNYNYQYNGPGSITEETNGKWFDIYSNFNDIILDIEATISNQYVIRYRSSNPVSDGTERYVEIQVSYHGNTSSCKGSYIPGSAPTIQRTSSTKELHNRAWAEYSLLTIEVEINDLVYPYVEHALLYFKSTSASNYQSVSMSNIAETTWKANIPTGYVVNPGIDYFITATDGENTVSDPSVDATENPYQLAVLPNVAPSINHIPITKLVPNQKITISADIIDNTNSLIGASVYYRKTGQLSYRLIEMEKSSSSNFFCEIPASDATTDGIDYYIKAWDDFGVSSYHGTYDNPHRITTSAGKIQLLNIYVKQKDELNFKPYSPRLSLGISKNDEVRFEGTVVDENNIPIPWNDITVYDPLLYNNETHSNGKLNILTDENGKFYYPSFTDAIQLESITPGVLTYWFKIKNNDSAIPFALIVNDKSLTVKEINNYLRRFTSSIPEIIDIQLDTSKSGPFSNLFIPAESYPINDNCLDDIENNNFFLFYSVCYSGPTDENFLLTKDYDSGWLKRGFNLYHQRVESVLQNLPERFEMIMPYNGMTSSLSKGLELQDYNPFETSNLIWYVGEGLVCASTLIPTGVTQVVGPVGCAALKIHLAKDAIKSTVTSDILQEPFGVNGNNELDESLELVVDVGTLLYDVKDLPKHVQHWHNPKNYMHGLPYGRIRAGAEMISDAVDIGQTSIESWKYEQVVGSYYLNSNNFYKGSQIENITYIPSGEFESEPIHHLNYQFTRSNAPYLIFDEVKFDNTENPNYLYINVTSTRPFYLQGTTIETTPEIIIDTKSYGMENITPLNTAPFQYQSTISVYELPFFHVGDPEYWTESIYCTGSNFETRWGECIGGFCGDTELKLELEFQNSKSLKKTSRKTTSKAILLLPANTFGEHNIFTSISLTSYNRYANKSQKNLKALSNAILVNTNSQQFEKSAVLNLPFFSNTYLEITPNINIYYHPLNGSKWEKLQTTVNYKDSTFSSTINEEGIYALLEEISYQIGPSTNNELNSKYIYCFPNPFNPFNKYCTIRYSIKEAGNITIKIYDAANSLVKNLITNSPKNASMELAEIWDGKNENGDIVANGVYFYVIESSTGEKAVGKVAVLR